MEDKFRNKPSKKKKAGKSGSRQQKESNSQRNSLTNHIAINTEGAESMETVLDKEISLLNSGDDIRYLQKLLIKSGATITSSEVERQVFGLSTQAAVKDFQLANNFPVTGVVDENTWARLTFGTVEERIGAGDFSSITASEISRSILRGLEKPDLSSPALNQEGSEIANALSAWKQTRLKRQVIKSFDNPSEDLTATINAMPLDIDSAENTVFSAFLSSEVLPQLLTNENLEGELFRFSRSGKMSSLESEEKENTVADMLGLQDDLREFPELKPFVNTIRNEVLGSVAGLGEEAVHALGDADVLDTDATMVRLEKEGVLSSEQKDSLIFAADLARLTDDNFKAIRVLIDSGVSESRELVIRDKADWLTFIEVNDIAPPENETPESYADILDRGVEKAFRTAYAISRYTAPVSEVMQEKISILEGIPNAEEDIFVDGGVSKDIDLSNFPADNIGTVVENLAELSGFANRYSGLGVTEILNNRELTTTEKFQSIEQRQVALGQVWTLYPSLDLKVANFLPGSDPAVKAYNVELEAIAEEHRPYVKRSLMSLQRVFQLSDTYDEADKLLVAGLDSAAKIAAIDDAQTLATRTGLDTKAAAMIKQRAGVLHAQVGHFVQGLEQTVGHYLYDPKVLNKETLGGNTDLINVLKDLPGYSELFGPQNYCQCEHCQSIFSPAAYFVDLMDFIEKRILTSNFINPDREEHPLYLKNRRPDLWNLPLTCENTNNAVIYLNIVNEVLENYLAGVVPLNGDIWAFLSDEARSSFNQPFNLPHAELLLYLNHLGIALQEVSTLFGVSQSAAVYTVLNISPQELTTLAETDIDAVRTRFAKPSPADLSEHNTAVLAKLSGVDRNRLERLWSVDFVKGNIELSVEITAHDDDLIGFEEYLRLSVPPGTDSEEGLKHFLDRLHRFTRLQRALGWTPEETQLVIATLRPPGAIAADSAPAAFSAVLDAGLLAEIAGFRQIKESLELSVSEVVALCHQIPDTPVTEDGKSLWAQLFGENTELEVRHPKLENTAGEGSAVSSGFGVLQGALRLAEPELIALLQRELAPADIASGIFLQADLYQLYRSVRLAQALELSQEQFSGVLAIVPTLASAATVAERLVALSEVLAWYRQARYLSYDLGKLLGILHLETHHDYESDAESLLADIQSTLKNKENLWLTPADLASIEGISAEASRIILAALEGRMQPWLTRPDPAVERYRLTDAVTETPDPQVIQEMLKVEGAPLAGMVDDDHSLAFLSEALTAELLQHHPALYIRDALAQALSISGEYAQAFGPLLEHLSGPLDTASWIYNNEAPIPASLLGYTAELIRLSRLFKGSLDAKIDSINFIVQYQQLFSVVPGQRWSWPVLHNIACLLMFSKQSEKKFLSYQSVLSVWDGVEFPVSTIADLVEIFDINSLQAESLLSEIPQSDNPFSMLQRLEEGVRLTKRTGLDPAALRQLTSMDFSGLLAAADLLRGAIRIKHPGAEVWRKIEATFSGKLAGLKRDALVDRILSRSELQFDNARDIYHFFLLDPEMDGCFLTSWVKNAISSCQLYVQRCLMGLESEAPGDTGEALQVTVAGGKKTREEWKWRKNYRIWEANRKVFLYPENYMLPDLRDNRSHIFKAAEQDLMQGKLDNTTIEQVFNRYIAEFAQVGNLIVVHILYEPGSQGYVLFGRTQQEPLRYFMREYDGKDRWGNWEPIDLDISAKTISAVRRQGKLYIFWTNVDLNADADKIDDANSNPYASVDDTEERLPISISYASLDQAGNWSSPQDMLYYSLLLRANGSTVNKLHSKSDRIYAEFPHVAAGGNGGVQDFIRFSHQVGDNDNGLVVGPRNYQGFLRESDNKIVTRNGHAVSVYGPIDNGSEWAIIKTPGFRLETDTLITLPTEFTAGIADVDYLINNEPYSGISGLQGGGAGPLLKTLTINGADNKRNSLHVVQRKTSEAVLTIGDIQYLVKRTGQPGSHNTGQQWSQLGEALEQARWKLVSLSSTWPDFLSEKFYAQGVDGLLTPESQSREEPKSWETIDYHLLGQIKWTDEDFLQQNKYVLAQFEGAHGNYLWEIFFHLPVLIAHTLNSLGKFEEADQWYRRVFDPLSAQSEPKDHWRFVVFRSSNMPKLRDILTQTSAIDVYKKDPFNPYAIARLRPAAFEKNVVMRYIDNILDWGDALFRGGTRESVNEALLLYIMAADLLGERPIEAGECEVADSMTYADIRWRNTGGEFLVELENLAVYWVNVDLKSIVDFDVELLEGLPYSPVDDVTIDTSVDSLPGIKKFTDEVPTRSNFEYFSTTKSQAQYRANIGTQFSRNKEAVFSSQYVAAEVSPDEPNIFQYSADKAYELDVDGPVQLARTLGFCVPPNKTLLGYWDRVEDRLYKLRHCMNIDGVERQLPLWQPPIDPMLLVRAKAAGLELDDVLAIISEQPPYQRFSSLLQRAQRFAATTQQLGNQLLSALERKDENELILLRSVHEDEILNLSRAQREDAIEEAKKSRAYLDEQEKTLEMRRDHYENLLENSAELGMNAEEVNALGGMQSAKDSQASAGRAESKAQRYRELGPQWSIGITGSVGAEVSITGSGPFSRMSTDASASWGSSNIEARFQRQAFRHRDAASQHNAAAGMSSTRASYVRRIEEWEFHLSVAQSEIESLVPQKAAADIRIALAEKELEVHDAQIRNSRELYDFAKERFTGLGLYTYLSTTLSRLHREAYDMAFKMAQVAERAYRFELGEDKFFIKMDNWDGSRAGLLCGDHLQLQLQAMEASFVEKDRRRQEITLPCSLAQIDPAALVNLRQTGKAEFSIPEWWFDLHYPGQYRRLLQAARLTIPCITGPYGNVGAKLTLLDSSVRATTDMDTEALVGVQVGRNSSISTSSANADPGVFELRFDAPKNPPFKGAGAVSSWTLDLPRVNRVFDYATISDLILELSYVADDDGVLRQNVEGMGQGMGSLDTQLGDGLRRIVSLRHEFPAEFQQLKTAAAQSPVALDLLLTRTLLFPYWISDRAMEITIDIAIEPKSGQGIVAADIQESVNITLNSQELSAWLNDPVLGSIPVASSSDKFQITEEPLALSLQAILPDDLEYHDLLIQVSYKTPQADN